MSTPEAIQHLIEHIKSMNADFFAIDAVIGSMSATRYNNVRLVIYAKGFSSATTQQSLHFLAYLGPYQPGADKGYNIWINDAKADNPRANQAAVVAALESLIKKGTWGSSTMISVTP